MAKIGAELKLYYCVAGIGGTPSWTEATKARDVTLDLNRGEADGTTRGSGGWKQSIPTLKEASVEFECVWDTSDPAYVALRDAWLNGTVLGMAVMDGDIEEAGVEGLWADMAVLKFQRKEPLDGLVTAAITVKPGMSANPPTWKTI